MKEIMPSIDLTQRFDLLREIIAIYRTRLTQLEAKVISLFEANELEAIADSMREKERIEQRIKKLEQFVSQWEGQGDFRID
ncbi:MAG: hypothetical protein H0Z34_14955 [Brevibacillus sp.]|nr:hypothetical protein [Brevibacillus sp.]